MRKISKRELNRMIRQAQLNAVVATLFIITIYSIGLASIVYMLVK